MPTRITFDVNCLDKFSAVTPEQRNRIWSSQGLVDSAGILVAREGDADVHEAKCWAGPRDV